MAFIVVAACVIDRVGRVKLLLLSTGGIAIAQLLLGLSFALGRVVPLALCGQALFMAAFSIGAGPCSMMVASELFPLQVRAAPMSLLYACVGSFSWSLFWLSFASL